MTKTTITEALAELKTIKSRIGKKRTAILTYVVRDTRARDPLEKDGGSAEWIRRERQAIADLEVRFVSIRNAIQAKNVATDLTVNGTTKTVAGWLNWKRELSNDQAVFFNHIRAGIAGARKQTADLLAKQVNQIANPDVPAYPLPDLAVNLDETALITEVENHDKTMGDLDGRLSLFNATTEIEI